MWAIHVPMTSHDWPREENFRSDLHTLVIIVKFEKCVAKYQPVIRGLKKVQV